VRHERQSNFDLVLYRIVTIGEWNFDFRRGDLGGIQSAGESGRLVPVACEHLVGSNSVNFRPFVLLAVRPWTGLIYSA
jgi:hypothetical protein